VRSDPLADPGTARDPSDNPPGGMPVEALPIGVEEYRPFIPFANCQVDSPRHAWREWHFHQLRAFAQHRQCAMSAFEPERFDVGADRFARRAARSMPAATPGRGPAAMTDRR
jgi:hypothetical protein